MDRPYISMGFAQYGTQVYYEWFSADTEEEAKDKALDWLAKDYPGCKETYYTVGLMHEVNDEKA